MSHDVDDGADLQTPAAIARPGEAIGKTLLQELATTVGTTAARERLRRRVLAVLGVVGAVAVAAVVGLSGDESLVPFAIYGALCLIPVLPLALVWGVSNRALLNAAARDAAVDDAVLAAAVSLVLKQRLGPSTALRSALSSSTKKTLPPKPTPAELPTTTTTTTTT